MSLLSTTKLSSRGQIVIPEDIRQKLKLDTGTQFIVLGEGDVVLLKTISKPSISDFDNLIKKAKKEAQKVGLTKSDITDAIRQVRAEK